MNLAIGRQVLVSTTPAGDGPDFAPAVIVRIHDDETVNVQIFHDGPWPGYATRVPVYATEDAARAELAEPNPETRRASSIVAWVPAGQAQRDAAAVAMAQLLDAETGGGTAELGEREPAGV